MYHEAIFENQQLHFLLWQRSLIVQILGIFITFCEQALHKNDFKEEASENPDKERNNGQEQHMGVSND